MVGRGGSSVGVVTGTWLMLYARQMGDPNTAAFFPSIQFLLGLFIVGSKVARA